jgi:predicted nucleic acid-binding protein
MKEYLLDTNILIYHFADTIKLPDAVIAATSLNNNLILVTRNEKDFKDVKELEVYNPFSGEI